MHATTAYARSQAEDKDVNRLVTDNLQLVRRIVGQLPKRTRAMVSEDDLYSSGTVGLVEAAHRYDPERNATFVTFAYRRIKGAVMDYLRKQDVLSKSARNRLDDVREEIRRFREVEGRKPTLAELAEATGLSQESLVKSLSNEKWNYLTSLEQQFHDNEGSSTPLSALLPAGTETPLEKMEHQEQIQLLQDAIRSLSKREQQVIVMYYYEELYMREIAEVLEVSESRVSQIHTKALYNLGRALEE
jgi:RNA polymerase sigma factor for flagellar operon FliA